MLHPALGGQSLRLPQDKALLVSLPQSSIALIASGGMLVRIPP